MNCPCGSGSAFAECCEPFLAGKAEPTTAEQMMRARYTAHTRAEMEFVDATLHPDNREEGDLETARRWAQESQWLGLEILGTAAGGPDDDEGVVEFIARYRDRKGRTQQHHERSLFVRVDGNWRFKEGAAGEQEQVRREGAKVGRNDPCPCGSGRKHKKCCARAA